MLKIENFEEGSKIYLKGFSKDEECSEITFDIDGSSNIFAVVTDLTSSAMLELTSAKEVDGMWNIVLANGKTCTLEKEPENVRMLHAGKIITGYVNNFFGIKYDVIFPEDYEETAKKIAEGSKKFMLSGYLNRHEICTSPIVKFWTDESGLYHGITATGSHYAFY